MTCLEMFLWIHNLKCHKNYKLSRLKTAKFVGCVSLRACQHATGTTLSKVVCLFPELPARESSEMSKWLLEEEKKKENERGHRMEYKTYVLFFWQAIIWIKVQEEGYTFSNWKHAPVKQITSHKPKIIRWDNEGKRREQWKRECETVGDEYIWRWGFPFGVAGPPSQFSSAIPSLHGALAEAGGGRGGAADQKDQSPVKVSIQNYYCTLTVELCMHCYSCAQ